MANRVALEHRTTYRYDRPVDLGPQLVRLRPAPHCRTPIERYAQAVLPADHVVHWLQDPWGNHVARYLFAGPASELAITVDLVADLTRINPFDFYMEADAATWPFAYDTPTRDALMAFLHLPTWDDASVVAWVDAIPRTPTPTIEFLVALNRRVLGDVAYDVRMEPGVLAPAETLRRAIGSCRDSAWLLVEVLRRLGLAARFASGYLIQLGEDGAPDVADLHAWAETYVPGAGWIGLDPTSGLLTGEGHIPLACTAEPAGAAPITGSTGAAAADLSFSTTVRRGAAIG
jgi:transglutaminase-like putative cysteine protease